MPPFCAALIGNVAQADYAAAKMGIVGLSQSIAIDMATVKGLGEPATGMLRLAEFYWNEDDWTRAFSSKP